MTRTAKRRSRANAAANVDYVGMVSESVTLAQEVRTFNVGPSLVDRVDDFVDRASDLTFRTRMLALAMPTLYQNISIGLVIAGMAAVYAIGGSGRLVAGRGRVDPGAGAVLQPAAADQLPRVWPRPRPTSRSSTSARTIYQGSVEQTGDRELSHIGRLALEDVWFAYVPGRAGPARASRSTSSRARPSASSGRRAAASRRSCSCCCACGIRPQGELLVDGENVDEVTFDSWYRRIAFVPQEPRLFQGTISDNIRFFRDDLDQEAIERAAKLAYLHDDVVSWADGYETLGGRARRRRVRRPAPAHRAGPRPGRGARRADPRRADQRARHEVRVARAGHPRGPQGSLDDVHHRPPPLDAERTATGSWCSARASSRASTPPPSCAARTRSSPRRSSSHSCADGSPPSALRRARRRPCRAARRPEEAGGRRRPRAAR